MRVVSAYRTISSEAACVIAGMIPICIILSEDIDCYQRRETRQARKLARIRSLAKWQQEWDASEKGRWTHRLIPNLSAWVNREHGEVNFHLTQFLSGHGCFKQYLHRFGHASSPFCPECMEIEETPEHVVFDCPRFNIERNTVATAFGEYFSVEGVVHGMISDPDLWNMMTNMVVQIMSGLQRNWREEQRNETQRAALDVGTSGR